MPKFSDELYLAVVLSTRAHAKILKIDATKALSLEGVVAFYSGKDLPEKQRFYGPIVQDEQVFISDKVRIFGMFRKKSQSFIQRRYIYIERVLHNI